MRTSQKLRLDYFPNLEIKIYTAEELSVQSNEVLDYFPNLEIKIYTAEELSVQLNEVTEGEVSLWQYDSQITWTINTKSFPTQQDSKYAKEQFQLAIQDWGIQGIEYKYIDESQIDNATFFLKYCKTICGGTVAKAFSPVEAQSLVIIYPIAYHEDKIKYMKNYLSHEIGHIYGLKHEFAKSETTPSVQFGPCNSESVMNYNEHPPVIQETDRMWVQKLYDKSQPINTIGSERLPVVRVLPYTGKG